MKRLVAALVLGFAAMGAAAQGVLPQGPNCALDLPPAVGAEQWEMRNSGYKWAVYPPLVALDYTGCQTTWWTESAERWLAMRVVYMVNGDPRVLVERRRYFNGASGQITCRYQDGRLAERTDVGHTKSDTCPSGEKLREDMLLLRLTLRQ